MSFTLFTLLAGPALFAELELLPIPSPAEDATRLPTLVRGVGRDVHLTWAEDHGEGTASLQHAVLRAGGWSTPAEIVRGPDLFLNWADFPSLAVLRDGTLLAHWLRRGNSGHGYDAEFSVLAPEGKWTAPRTLHDDTSQAEHGFVSAVPLDPATFGTLWLDGRAMGADAHGHGKMGLYYRTIDAKGALGQELLLDPDVCSCCQTSLVRTASGSLVAAYRDHAEGEVRDISFVVNDGEGWSEPRTVHDDGWVIAGCPVNGPRLAASGEDIAIAWFTGVGQGGGNVQVAFRGASGEFGLPIDVDDGHPIGRVDLVFLDEESLVVTWLEYAGAEVGAEWRARRIRLAGGVDDSISIANVTPERGSGYLRMVAGAGEAWLAWTATDESPRVECARLVLR